MYAEAASRTHLKLLSGFDLVWQGSRLLLPLGAQRLMAFLAVHGRPLLRSFVAGSLWGESSDDHALRDLRTALWRVRKHALAIIASDSYVALDAAITVDLHENIASARRVLGGDPVAADDLDPVRLAGDLLPDWYDEWVIMERERYRQLRLHALEVVCIRLTALGRHSEAVQAGLAAVEGEPLRDSGNFALVSAYLAEGNRSEALRAFERYRTVLAAELSLAPSPKLEALIRGASAGGRPTTPAAVDSLRSQAIRVVAAGQLTG